jgi:hypothetical protein
MGNIALHYTVSFTSSRRIRDSPSYRRTGDLVLRFCLKDSVAHLLRVRPLHVPSEGSLKSLALRTHDYPSSKGTLCDVTGQAASDLHLSMTRRLQASCSALDPD